MGAGWISGTNWTYLSYEDSCEQCVPAFLCQCGTRRPKNVSWNVMLLWRTKHETVKIFFRNTQLLRCLEDGGGRSRPVNLKFGFNSFTRSTYGCVNARVLKSECAKRLFSMEVVNIQSTFAASYIEYRKTFRNSCGSSVRREHEFAHEKSKARSGRGFVQQNRYDVPLAVVLLVPAIEPEIVLSVTYFAFRIFEGN